MYCTSARAVSAAHSIRRDTATLRDRLPPCEPPTLPDLGRRYAGGRGGSIAVYIELGRRQFRGASYSFLLPFVSVRCMITQTTIGGVNASSGVASRSALSI